MKNPIQGYLLAFCLLVLLIGVMIAGLMPPAKTPSLTAAQAAEVSEQIHSPASTPAPVIKPIAPSQPFIAASSVPIPRTEVAPTPLLSTRSPSAAFVRPSEHAEFPISTPASFDGQVAASQQAAVKKYPALGVAGSNLNLKFLEEYRRLKKADSDWFVGSDWPELLATQCQDRLDDPMLPEILLRPGNKAQYDWDTQSPTIVASAPASYEMPSAYVTPSTYPSSSGGDVYVHGYYRKDGTYVHSYSRRPPSQ